MKHLIATLSITLVCSISLLAQDLVNFNNDNYAGVNSVDLNPAMMVNSPYKADINLAGASFTVMNNYIGLRRTVFKDNGWDDPDFKEKYLNERINRDNKFGYVNAQLLLPSFMFNFGKNGKNAIAVSSRTRVKVMAFDIHTDLAKQMWEELKYEELWQTPLNDEDFSIQTLAWMEYRFSYGREILDKGKHYLKAGGSVKLLQGLGSAYFYADDLNYMFTNNDTLSLFESDIQYGHSSNFEFQEDNIRYKFESTPSVGFDIGAVYEWRPNNEEYKYDMDGEYGMYRRDKNKYRLRVGFSMLDIGVLKFKKGENSADFKADIDNWDISQFSLGDGETAIQALDDTISSRFTRLGSDDRFYRMNLPTAISFQVDAHLGKGFYANFTPYFAIQYKNDANKVTEVSSYNLGLRYEWTWFSFGLPYNYNKIGGHGLGAYMRLGPLVVGTDDWLSLAVRDEIYRADAYVMLKVPIPHGKPKDADGDLVSNKKDKCKRDKGSWETMGCPDSDDDGIYDEEDLCPNEYGPEDNGGCPYKDSDGDGIDDYKDECPDTAGLKKYEGCPPPDTDGDGINDEEDFCIDEPGPKENDGCPYGDLDGDGVNDGDDKCPDEPGPASNDGCPDDDRDGDGVLNDFDECPDTPGFPGNDGCPYPDTDGDGVRDKDDKCPNTPGPVDEDGCPDSDGDSVRDDKDKCPQTPGVVANDGCPELKEEEKEVIQTAFDNLEFETGRAKIKSSSYQTMNNLAKLLKDKPDAKLRIAGHTDNVGSDETNMKLSKERAEAVSTYMIGRGVPESQLQVEYFGETQPIADNNTPEGRQANRRVELELIWD